MLTNPFIFILVFFVTLKYVNNCKLPTSWSGSWTNQQNKDNYHDKEMYVLNSATVSNFHGSNSQNMIDETHFLNRGKCMSNRDERFFFYNKHEKCYRCLFIIQRHSNVIQFRETHCDEDLKKFEELCELLTPDLPLLTMIREDAIPEKCPLSESYKIFSKIELNLNSQKIFSNESPYGSNSQIDYLKSSNFDQISCLKKPSSQIISNCPDNTMLRLDFQECFDLNSAIQTSSVDLKFRKIEKNQKNNSNDEALVAQCIAHWNEGNLNYLILKQNKNSYITSRNKNFKCLIFKDLDRPFKNRNNKILNPTNNLIQMSLSDDEFCREFYTTSDGINSFTLEKIHVNRIKKDLDLKFNCRFPKILNKKWKNLQQNRNIFKLNSNLIQIGQYLKGSRSANKTNKKYAMNQENVFYKLGCMESLNKHFINNNEIDTSSQKDYKNYDYDYLVNNLHDCSSKQQCLSIRFKSEFIMQIKYANYDSKNQECLFDEKNIIYEDIYFIDSDYGSECPFNNRVYQLSSDKEKDTNLKKRSLSKKQSQFSIVFDDDIDSKNSYKPECEHFLKIGCNSKDYTIHKKCKYNLLNEGVHHMSKRSFNSPYALPLFRNNIYFDEKLPVVESETNRICLAYWKIDENPEFLRLNNEDDEAKNEIFVVLSKQMNSENNSITCSVWETRNNRLMIKDDNSLSLCFNYKKILNKNYKTSLQHKNYLLSVASAMISSNYKEDDESISFEYSSGCSANNSKRIEIKKLNVLLSYLLIIFIKLSGMLK